MSVSYEQYTEIQRAQQLFLILDSMGQGGWRADQQLLDTKPLPGVDTLCGAEFFDEINLEMNSFLTKINRKMLKRVKVVKKEVLVTLGGVDGMLEDMYVRMPTMDPEYVDPASVVPVVVEEDK
jgi:hypothetical protein